MSERGETIMRGGQMWCPESRAIAAEAEIADLQAKLHAAEKERDRLQTRVWSIEDDVIGPYSEGLERVREAARDAYAVIHIGNHGRLDEVMRSLGAALAALDNDCPAGEPHTLASDGSDECVECGAPRPKFLSNPNEQG